MLHKEIVSSNIQTLGYRRGSLYIKFNSGHVYRYDQVSYKVFRGLSEAESVGKMFHADVRGRYRGQKLDNDPFTRNADVLPTQAH